MSQQVKLLKSKLQRAVLTAGVIVLAAAAGGRGDDGEFRLSPHGSVTDGVLRLTEYPRGSCIQCHSSHPQNDQNAYGLFVPNSNELCFAQSAGGCHADEPTGATAGYPAQESDRMPIGSADPGYFEFNSGGVRLPGVQNLVRWPGRVIWENALYSPHQSDQDMPIKDYFSNGSCDNCHNVHGTGSMHDMLDTTYQGITYSELGFEPESYALCLRCHRIDGPTSMDDTSKTIAYYYDRSINPGRRTGHGVSGGGGYMSAGQMLPCYDCHNPHGSAGYAGQGPNSYLLSDQRPGWYGLNDIRNDNTQARRFCFGCHPSADGIEPGGQVEGVALQPLPSNTTAHNASGTVHCYDCHGRDYSSPTSNNVHNPAPGGQATGPGIN